MENGGHFSKCLVIWGRFKQLDLCSGLETVWKQR